MRLLLVEDEKSLQKMIKMNLELEGYEVVAVDNGKDALKKYDEQHFDLLLLDIMLPDMDGLQVCQHVRLTNTKVPVLFLTAKDSPQDRVDGLKRGGDDYLTKPFNLEELLLRIKNLLRRSSSDESVDIDNYQFGSNKVNFNTYEASNGNGTFSLTKKEVMLLKLLIDRKNEVVSRNEILQSVWGYDIYPSTRTIDNFILSFRKYFEEDSRNPKYFKSVRGVGYKFVNPEN